MEPASALGRLSINTATTKHLTLEQAAAGAAAAGLAYLAPWRDRVAEVGTTRARAILDGAGLQASSLCRGGFLTASDSAGQAAALADNRRAIEEAAAIGASELLLVVGGLPAARVPYEPAAAYPAGVDPEAADPARDLAAARQRVADRMGELVPFAEQRGVRLALEPLHPMFAADRAVVSTLGQALDLAEQFPAAAVGVVVDSYHVWWDPEVSAQIARAGREGRIAGYQVSDWILPLTDSPLNSRGHVGDGYIDFAFLTRCVRDAGYAGPVEVEIFNEQIWAAPAEHTLATVADRYLRHVAAHL